MFLLFFTVLIFLIKKIIKIRNGFFVGNPLRRKNPGDFKPHGIFPKSGILIPHYPRGFLGEKPKTQRFGGREFGFQNSHPKSLKIEIFYYYNSVKS